MMADISKELAAMTDKLRGIKAGRDDLRGYSFNGGAAKFKARATSKAAAVPKSRKRRGKDG
jgi:hypothetical protein